MVSRRLLRVKVLKILFAYLQAESRSQLAAEKELAFSIKKSYDLYHLVFLLVTELADYAKERIDIGLQKHLPTPEELNPNKKFVENEIIKIIDQNKPLHKYCEYERLNWSDCSDMIKKLYTAVASEDYFKEYMLQPERKFDQDKALVCKILETDIENFDDIDAYLEERSIYWVDDLGFVLSMAIKTIKRFKQNQSEQTELMPLYKDESDKNFAVRLLRRAIADYDENRALIDKNITNWDVERIAFMDTVIMHLAVAEASEFPEIPTNVTIDEYLEISKFYSTPTSSGFINGILDKVINKMIEDKTIIKNN